MLADTGWSEASPSQSRHSWRASQRPHRKITASDHAMLAIGGCLILAVAVICGILVDQYFFLLLLVLMPYSFFWFALKEKDDRILTLQHAIAQMEAAKEGRTPVRPMDEKIGSMEEASARLEEVRPHHHVEETNLGDSEQSNEGTSQHRDDSVSSELPSEQSIRETEAQHKSDA